MCVYICIYTRILKHVFTGSARFQERLPWIHIYMYMYVCICMLIDRYRCRGTHRQREIPMMTAVDTEESRTEVGLFRVELLDKCGPKHSSVNRHLPVVQLLPEGISQEVVVETSQCLCVCVCVHVCVCVCACECRVCWCAYRVANTLRMPGLYRSFPAKEHYD